MGSINRPVTLAVFRPLYYHDFPPRQFVDGTNGTEGAEQSSRTVGISNFGLEFWYRMKHDFAPFMDISVCFVRGFNNLLFEKKRGTDLWLDSPPQERGQKIIVRNTINLTWGGKGRFKKNNSTTPLT